LVSNHLVYVGRAYSVPLDEFVVTAILWGCSGSPIGLTFPAETDAAIRRHPIPLECGKELNKAADSAPLLSAHAKHSFLVRTEMKC
jgi:hypothetical protein